MSWQCLHESCFSRSDNKLPSNVPRRNSKRTKKNDKENETTKNGHCEDVDATSTASDSAVNKKEKKGVVKWLTSAFRKSKDKELSDNSSSNSS